MKFGNLKKFERFEFFQIEVTRKCSLNCVMCPHRRFDDQIEMDFDVFREISRYFDRTKVIHLQGWGEPLLHPRIFEMIEISKMHARTGLTTNGVLLGRKICERIVELSLDYIAVSIGGEQHSEIRRGSDFRQVIDNVRRLNEVKKDRKMENPRVNLTFLMTRTNISNLPAMVDLAHELNAGLIATNLDYVFDEDTNSLKAFGSKERKKTMKYVKEAEKKAKKLGVEFHHPSVDPVEEAVCDALPHMSITFSAEGDVYPCVYLCLPFKKIPRVSEGRRIEIERPHFGNVMKNSLDKIWNSEKYRAFRKKFENRIKAIDDPSLIFAPQSIRYLFNRHPPPEECKGCYKLYGI